MKNLLYIFLIFCALISCTDDTDFQVVESEVGGVEIIGNGGKNIRLAKDTSWYISDADGKRIYTCDEYKIAAFFNVLRDVQVMGLSTHPQYGNFDSEIV